MSVIETATRRRVTVAMGAVALLLFGSIALNQLEVNLLPELSYPTLTVRTEFAGAAPEEVENLVTEPVEEALGVVKNVISIHSVSRAGQSDVVLEFAWGTAMDQASLEVREKIETLQLPLEAERPLLLRFNPATDPIIRLGFSMEQSGADAASSVQALKGLRRYAEENLKKTLETVPGVAAVKVSGGLEDEISIGVDQARLARLDLSIADVVQRLEAENVNLSSGRLETGRQRFLVRTLNQFQSVEEIRNLVLEVRDGRPIYLDDVASVSQGYHEREAIIRLNGQEAVELAIYKEGDANTVHVAEAVHEQLSSLREDMPGKTQLIVVDDQSVFISQAVSNVVSAAWQGGLLAILVLYLFLNRIGSTLIIAVAIPLSIVATFFLMYSTDISLNIMSLGGIALAAGMLVDNSIVVLENIARHREAGAGAEQAAVRGTGEVSQAVVASTLTTVAVFVPLVFVEGIGGQLFRDQALTVTYALLISLAVALTLVPMLASLQQRAPMNFAADPIRPARRPRTRAGHFARQARQHVFTTAPAATVGGLRWVGRRLGRGMRALFSPLVNGVHTGFEHLRSAYGSLLPWALSHRAVVLLSSAGLLALSLLVLTGIGSELIPQLQQGRFEVKLRLPPGTPIERTDSLVAAFQHHAAGIEGIETLYAVSGSGNRLDANPASAGENTGSVLVVLQDDADESRVMAELREFTRNQAGLEARFTRPELFSLDNPVEVQVSGYDLTTLKQLSDQVAAALRASSRFVDVESSLEQGQPEVRVIVDQERAANLGLTVRAVADRVVSKVRGQVATRYNFRDRKIDVLVRVEESDRASLEDLRGLIVNPGSEREVPLSAVAELVVGEGPAEINRIDQERVALVTAGLRFGDLGAAVEEARDLVEDIPVPLDFDLEIAGQNEEMQRSYNSLLFALGLAVFLVYLVMASQFESLLHPFVVLFAIPLSLIGVALALFVTGTELSVLVFIGVIMLAGIVVNNAIVLIDFINRLREQGMDKEQAIIEAGHARLRPIAMTTLTTVLGLIPMALGIGEGSEVRAPMAITVIGGLTVSTLLTLIVVPVIYASLDRGAQRARAPVTQTAD